MNDGYTQTVAYFEKHKPHLIRTFQDTLDLLKTTSAGVDLPVPAARCFALASEHLYIPPDTIRRAADRKEADELSQVLYTLSRRGTSLAHTVLKSYSNLRFAFCDVSDDINIQVERHLCELDRPEAALSFCLSAPNADQCVVFLKLFGAMATSSPKAVGEFLLLYEKVRPEMPWPSMKKWLERGVDLVTSARTEDGVRYLLGQAKESRKLLDMRFALLDDMKNILHIYCGSIGGRTFGIQSTVVSSVGIQNTYTDGGSIFLQPTLSLFDTIEENEAAYTAIAATQAAIVSYDTFSLDFNNLDFLTELRERYATVLPDIMENVRKQYQHTARTVRERATGEVEAVFGGERILPLLQTPHEELFYLFPTPDLIREIFIMIELCRIQAVLSAKYSGLKADFSKISKAKLANQPPIDIRTDLQSADFARFFEYVVDRTIRFALGDTSRRDPDTDRTGRILSRIERVLNDVMSHNSMVYDSARAAFLIYNELYDNFPVVLWCRENDVRTLFSPYLDTTICPEIAFDVSPDLFIGAKERPVFDDLEEPEEREIDLTRLTQSERKAFELRRAILSGDIRIFRYPEFDVFRGDYIPKYCTLYESVLPFGNQAWAEHILAHYQRVYKKLKKRFLMMEPEELQISRKWLQGDEMNLSDTVDYLTDLFRGECPDEKIYARRIRNIRDIAAGILIDASSSTREPVGSSTVIQIEKTALFLLSSVLSVLGDSFGIYSFFSMGRSNIFFSVAKDFEEPWNQNIQSRIENIEANAGNRDGCAIRHLTAKLLSRPEKTKLLILLSDGIPADADYGDNVGETGKYAIEDTRKAIIDTRKQGVIPYCITIDRRARDYTPHLYGDFNYTVLDDVTQLPEKLSRLYLRLTR